MVVVVGFEEGREGGGRDRGWEGSGMEYKREVSRFELGRRRGEGVAVGIRG